MMDTVQQPFNKIPWTVLNNDRARDKFTVFTKLTVSGPQVNCLNFNKCNILI